MNKSKKLNEFNLVLDAVSSNEGFARQVVASFFAQLDPTVEELADLRCAVSEAVTNVVVHAYKGSKDVGKIAIYGAYYDDRTAVLRITDKGVGMENVAQCLEPLYTTDTSGERGGMGFAIMGCFTDKLNVKSSVGKGTVVTLTKKLK